MVDLHITFSRSHYQPGQTFNANIQFQNNLTSNVLPVDGRLNRRGDKHRSHLKSDDSDKNRLGNTHHSKSATVIPSSNTTCTVASSVPSRVGHNKSKSVSFSSITAPSKDEAMCQSSYRDEQEERFMIVHAQVIGTFTSSPTLVQGTKFDHLKGQGMTGSSGGGVVLDNSTNSSRWSLAIWSGVFGTSQKSSLEDLRRAATGKTLPVLTTMPTILEVDLSLAPGETKEATFSVRLPECLPPSYSGQACKISYELRLVAQRHNNSSAVYTCPIWLQGGAQVYDFTRPVFLGRDRVLPKVTSQESGDTSASSSVERSKVNLVDSLDLVVSTTLPVYECFMLSSQPHQLPLHLQGHSTTREAARFDICRNDAEQVGILALHSRTYLPGEILIGQLDFRKARVKCLKYIVSLEASEFIHSDYMVQTQERTLRATRQTLQQDSIWCPFSASSSFEIAIPAALTASFESIPFELRYHLHFEFIISAKNTFVYETRTKQGIETGLSPRVLVEPFECRIPITILCPDDTQRYISTGRL